MRERELLGCHACIPHATIDSQIHLCAEMVGVTGIGEGGLREQAGETLLLVSSPTHKKPIRIEAHD